MADNPVTLEQVLVNKKLLSVEQLKQLRLKMAQTGKGLKSLVLSEGLVGEREMSQAEAEVLGVPYLAPELVGASPEVLNMVSQSLARRFEFFPVSIDKINKIMTVVMADPRNVTAIEFLKKRFDVDLSIRMAGKTEIEKLIEERYSAGLAGDVTEALQRGGERAAPGAGVVVSEEEARLIRQPAVVKVVNQILGHAVRLRASDVHIEPEEGKTRVRYRIDGLLQEKLELPREMHPAVVSRIKILSGMKIDERRLPQDGRFNFTADGGEVDLRVSSLPTSHGEKIVMRLLKKSAKVPALEELGLRGRALKSVREAILVPHGIILATGPTGSGKSTTLYSILAVINKITVNIITLEDPVEYQMPGINQVQVNPQAGLTFATGLRSFLRQDPDIIMVGEIRDEETTDLAIQAALTGHLVFSTVHTNSAAGAIPRLMDLKAEPFLLVSSLTSVIGQRVVRKICSSCKQSYVPETTVVEDIKKELGSLYEAWRQSNPVLVESATKVGAEILLYRGKGGDCPDCGGSGYLGRVGLFEVLSVTPIIAKLIAERAGVADIENQAVKEGMITMKQDGYFRALEGVSTIEEVLRVAQDRAD